MYDRKNKKDQNKQEKQDILELWFWLSIIFICVIGIAALQV